MPKDLVFDLSPMQDAFVHCDQEIVMIMGAMAEGKTFAGVVALMAHAVRCERNILGALIRDTHQNIKISTVHSIQEALGNRVSFHDDFKKMTIHSTPRVDMDLFGIDDPASLSKLQGPEYSIIWLEEPAPILEKANAGLPQVVDGKTVWRQTPDEFASYVPALVEAGASFIGGCCGTSPEFIKAIKEKLSR